MLLILEGVIYFILIGGLFIALKMLVMEIAGIWFSFSTGVRVRMQLAWPNDIWRVRRWLASLKKARELVTEETFGHLKRINFQRGTLGCWRAQARVDWRKMKFSVITVNLESLMVAPLPRRKKVFLKRRRAMDTAFSFVHGATPRDEEAEMLYVWLHELGHLYAENSGLSGDIINIFTRRAVTAYGRGGMDGDPTSYSEFFEGRKKEIIENAKADFRENFAEAYTLYILMPGYLRKGFPLEYMWLEENAFGGREYDIGLGAPRNLLRKIRDLRVVANPE